MIDNKTSRQSNELRQELIAHFPRSPYQIQLNIAQMLHQILQNGKIKLAIIQSPTGTGKTYSLLVPLIVWLNKNRTKSKILEGQSQKKTTVPSWLKKPSEHKVEKLLSEKKRRVEEAIHITQAQQQLKRLRLKHSNTAVNQKQQQQIEVQSQDEDCRHNFKRKHNNKLDLIVEKQLKVEDETALPKIIFISRTHSQLAQVIESIKQVTKEDDELKYVEIASKQHLCINPTINANKLNISERCQYILDHSKCDFFHNLSIKEFFNNNLEEANSLGTNHRLCPYYATRNLIQECDILCLPYASILNSEIRTRIGVNIHNSIIVFDQGHNVIDNEKQLHSPEVFLEDLVIFSQQIDEYTKKYGERLKANNYQLLLHLLEILRTLVVTVQKYKKENATSGKKYVKVGYLPFIGQMAIKELKIFKIVRYVQLNNLDQKLAYFNSNEGVSIDKSKQKQNKGQQKRISVSKINNILQFLLQFSYFNEQKQILLLKWGESKGSIKILCLESEQLEKIIHRSRLTIVAGGTMQPLDDFQPLLQKLKEKVIIKKYPHIIQKNQCNLYIVKRNSNREIIFNHQNLNDQKQLEGLKHTCLNAILKIVKKTEKGGGIVIFIQNYRLIAFFRDAFKNQSCYSRMLFDSKQPQESNKDVFQTYKSLVEKNVQDNYILVSVMGGKLSQGINFSDRLARSLVVFGLPYANIYSPEVVETVSHLESNKKSTKKEYLQALCLRTLNQTIGRGVRHIKDYVNIYLIDARFQGIRHKLSEWMRDRVTIITEIDQI